MKNPMKYVVGKALDTIPRPWLQRLARVCVPAAGLLYLGRGRKCPICGAERRKFLPYGYGVQRDDALCPVCLSLERHRALWLVLQGRAVLLSPLKTLLHIAPEPCLKSKFGQIYAGTEGRYITADLESPWAALHFDVQAIPLPDESIDAVICNHLLEHIDNDRLAMRELYRILRPGGWGVLLVPLDSCREHTFEDAAATTPEQRAALFGQYDHRRIYGRDYVQRLREAGFETEVVPAGEGLSEAERREYALGDEAVYMVHKPLNY